MAQQLQLALLTNGYEVTVCHQKKQAAEYLSVRDVDLVLLNASITFTVSKQIPVIVLFGTSQKATANNVIGFVSSQQVMPAFAEVIRQCFESWSRRQ